MNQTPWYRRKLAPRWRWSLAIVIAASILVAWTMDGSEALLLQAVLIAAAAVILVVGIQRAET